MKNLQFNKYALVYVFLAFILAIKSPHAATAYFVLFTGLSLIGFPLYLKASDFIPASPKIVEFLISSFLGLQLLTLICLYIGMAGGSLSGPAILTYSAGPLIYGCWKFIKKSTGKSSEHRWGFAHIALIVFFTVLSLKSLSNSYPSWDNYTFWSIDSKIIFESGKLRVGSSLSWIPYTSYFSIHDIFIYYLMGGIYEQAANIFVVFYCLMGCIFSILICLRTPLNSTALVTTSLMGITLVFATVKNLLFCGYAETLTACWITAIAFSIQTFFIEENSSKQKAIAPWILAGLFFLAMPKSTNYAYSLAITVLFLFFNFLQYKNIPRAFLQPKIFGQLLLILIFYILHVDFIENTSSKKFISLTFRHHFSLEEHLNYLKLIFKQILKPHYPTFLGFILGSIALFKSKNIKNFFPYFVFSVICTLPAINIFYFFMKHYPLNSKSIQRYVTTVFFLIPCLFFLTRNPIQQRLENFRYKNYLPWIVTLLTVLFYFDNGKIFSPSHVALSFGEKPSFHSRFKRDVEDIADYTTDKSILLITAMGGDRVVSMHPPSLQKRYFLHHTKVVCGAVSTRDIFSFLKDSNCNPNYILLDFKKLEESKQKIIGQIALSGFSPVEMDLGEKTFLFKKDDLQKNL